MATCNYNCTDLGEHEQVTCGAYKTGGIPHLAVLECDHSIVDFTDPAEWEAAIAAGEVKIISNVKAQFPAPTPSEVENPVGCGAETILTNFDRTLTFTDGNITSNNNDFYNSLNRRNFNLVAYHCADDVNGAEISVIDARVTAVVSALTPASNKEHRKYEGTFKWTAFDNPATYSAPIGIFD